MRETPDVKNKTAPWLTRAYTEYSLRSKASMGRVLMSRYCDINGKDPGGKEVCWRDIATFDDPNDAEMVLRQLRLGSQRATSEKTSNA